MWKDRRGWLFAPRRWTLAPIGLVGMLLLAGCNFLAAGNQLASGTALTSANGQYTATMDSGGDFVVLGPDNKLVWDTGTSVAGSTLSVGTDGSLVVTAPDQSIQWSAETTGLGTNLSLTLQNDGTLTLSPPSGPAVWTDTQGLTESTASVLGSNQVLAANQQLVSPSGDYHADMQSDGNFVVYPAGDNSSTGGAVWNTQTGGNPGDYVTLQTDGNLVVYPAGHNSTTGGALWNAGTQGNSNVFLKMQDDGNLVVYTSSGQALWSSMYGKAGAIGTGVSGSNDYPWSAANPNSLSPLRFNYRNCTDFVEWKINEERGGSTSNIRFSWSSLEFPGGNGNASGWRAGASGSGYVVSGTPVVGAIAWWGTEVGGGAGHVAVVTGVNADGSVSVAEYNSQVPYGYDTRPSVRADAYLYIT